MTEPAEADGELIMQRHFPGVSPGEVAVFCAEELMHVDSWKESACLYRIPTI